jgi:hypothetical protein
MRQIKYRALVTLDPPARGAPSRQYPSGTHALMIHAERIGQPSCDKYFPAAVYPDDELPLKPGEQRLVTIAVTGDDAPSYLAAGQPFTIWGGGSGHGIISRRLFTVADLI